MSQRAEQLSQHSPDSLLALLKLLSEKRRMLTVIPLGVGAASLALSFLLPPIFTATTQILPPTQQSGASALLGSLGGLASSLSSSGLGAIAGLKNPADQWVGILFSRNIADALIKRFDLKKQYAAEYQFEARETLAQRTKIIIGKDGLIDIFVDDESAEKAAAIANAYVEELQRVARELSLSDATSRRKFLEDHLKTVSAKLASSEKALMGSGVSQDIIKIDPEASATEVAALRAQIAAQQVRIEVMRTMMTQTSPDLQKASAELEALKKLLRQSEVGKRESDSKEAPSYIEKYRDFKYQETLFELLSKQYELARIDEANAGVVIQVVDPAVTPEWKSRPKRALIALGSTLFTFLVLCGNIFFRSKLLPQAIKRNPALREQ